MPDLKKKQKNSQMPTGHWAERVLTLHRHHLSPLVPLPLLTSDLPDREKPLVCNFFFKTNALMTWFCMINHCHFKQSSIYIPAKKKQTLMSRAAHGWQKTVNLVFGGLWFWWYLWFKYRRAAAGFHKCHRSQTPESTRISVTWSVKKGPSMSVSMPRALCRPPTDLWEFTVWAEW